MVCTLRKETVAALSHLIGKAMKGVNKNHNFQHMT